MKIRTLVFDVFVRALWRLHLLIMVNTRSWRGKCTWTPLMWYVHWEARRIFWCSCFQDEI